jgi:hypothetical protein
MYLWRTQMRFRKSYSINVNITKQSLEHDAKPLSNQHVKAMKQHGLPLVPWQRNNMHTCIAAEKYAAKTALAETINPSRLLHIRRTWSHGVV